MNFLWKKIAAVWAIIPTIALFLFGSGVFWEWRKMPLVDLELGRGLAELYQKKAAALEDIFRPEMLDAPSDSPVLKAKIDYLNSLEKTIAQIEGRLPVIYARRVANVKKTLGDAKLKAEGTVRDSK